MTSSNPKERETVRPSELKRWPSVTQILRQIVVVVIVGAIWAALFAGFLHLAGGDVEPETIAPVTLVDPDAPAGVPEEVSYARDVQPVLDRRCVKCHGGERAEEGLELATYDDTLNGSWNGPVVAPGRPADSMLVEVIESGDMPKNEPRLLPAEIRTIIAWVDAGALNN